MLAPGPGWLIFADGQFGRTAWSTHTHNSAFVLANSVRALCNPGPSAQKHTHKDDYSATQVFIILVSITFCRAVAGSKRLFTTHSLTQSLDTHFSQVSGGRLGHDVNSAVFGVLCGYMLCVSGWAEVEVSTDEPQ